MSGRNGGVCRYVTAVCACSWSGTIAATASCPACGLTWQARIDKKRCDMLDALIARPTALANVPMMRRRLIHLGLVLPSGPRRPPGNDPRRKPPGRHHEVTPRGMRARDAFRAVERADSERRAIAGATAARHADLPEATSGGKP